MPSYTDRILWRDRPGLATEHTQLWLAPFPSFSSSDHKPVAAVHALRVPKATEVELSLKPKQQLGLVVANLRANRLPPMDKNGLADPYVAFACPELGLAGSLSDALANPPVTGKKSKLPSAPKTAVRKKNLNPRWLPAELPELFATVPSGADVPAALRRAHLLLHVWDFDRGSADDLIGTATISLAGCCSPGDEGGAMDPMEFEAVIYRGSRPQGVIAGRLTVLPP